jgi:MSHA pilin protein MshA
MIKTQKGFTLIELVVVIVILGILAAFAIPRYVNTTTEARTAAVNGIAGGLRSAVTLAKAKYQVVGNLALATVNMDGTLVACAVGTGIPTGAAAGIGAALQDTSGFTIVYGAVTTFQPTNGGSATCQASYTAATGAVTVVTTGC